MDFATDTSKNVKPVIIIHGGAWAIPEKLSEASKSGVKLAAKIGIGLLLDGGSALDAVEAAIRSLEDDPGISKIQLSLYTFYDDLLFIIIFSCIVLQPLMLEKVLV